MEDIFTYRVILVGIQQAMDLHLGAIVESTGNESMRRLYTRFLFDEISLHDRFLKYGKTKGWTYPPPTYAEPS